MDIVLYLFSSYNKLIYILMISSSPLFKNIINQIKSMVRLDSLRVLFHPSSISLHLRACSHHLLFLQILLFHLLPLLFAVAQLQSLLFFQLFWRGRITEVLNRVIYTPRDGVGKEYKRYYEYIFELWFFCTIDDLLG